MQKKSEVPKQTLTSPGVAQINRSLHEMTRTTTAQHKSTHRSAYVVQLMLYNRCRAADVVQSKTYNQCRTIDDHPRAQARTLFLSLILSIGLFFRGISRSDFRILGNSFFLHSSPSLRPLLAHNNYASTNITRTC